MKALSCIDERKQDFCRFIRNYFDEMVPLVQKTSGTTGDPTIIFLQWPAMVRSAGMKIDRNTFVRNSSGGNRKTLTDFRNDG
jgi:hypothetical protein